MNEVRQDLARLTKRIDDWEAEFTRELDEMDRLVEGLRQRMSPSEDDEPIDGGDSADIIPDVRQ